MNQTVTTVIDPELCVGCGACVDVCPSDTITLDGDVAVVTGDRSLNCGHCAAACPEGAITVRALDPGASRFETFDLDPAWLPHGEGDTAALVRLVGSRRSCRNYTEEPVDRRVLDDLVKIGAMAPSGTNTQGWIFSVLPDRRVVLDVAERVFSLFRLVDRAARKPALSAVTKLVPGMDLDSYLRDTLPRMRERVDEHDRGGREPLFHGATAAIVIASKPLPGTPAADGLLAAQNILLAAHTMGLGSCLIGFLVVAARADPRIGRALGLARGEKVRAVVALGHPKETYERIAGRKPIDVRYL